LLQEKNKEAEARVNDLSDELELESGLREEMKLETVSLEEKLKELEEERVAFADEIGKKEELHKKLTKDLSASEQKIKALEAQLKAEIERSQKLGQLYEQKQKEEVAKAESVLKYQTDQATENKDVEKSTLGESANLGIELEEIVIVPSSPKTQETAREPIFEDSVVALSAALNGRILSVDTETEFVIVSLGEKDGLAVGNVLSIYRNENYVGDIKITRLQSEMSAADLILPLSIRNVKKDDQVKTK
jgi:chromosome segregation ATPase